MSIFIHWSSLGCFFTGLSPRENSRLDFPDLLDAGSIPSECTVGGPGFLSIDEALAVAGRGTIAPLRTRLFRNGGETADGAASPATTSYRRRRGGYCVARNGDHFSGKGFAAPLVGAPWKTAWNFRVLQETASAVWVSGRESLSFTRASGPGEPP
jgi:hypothetical protein